MLDRRRFCQIVAAGATVGLVGPARRTVGASPLAASPATPVASPVAGPERGALWVQDNNMGHAGGLPPDFKAMFTTRRDEWAAARRFIDVYQLRSTSLRDPTNDLSDAFLGDAFLPLLRDANIALSLNVVGAMGLACNVEKGATMAAEIAQIARIARLGGRVDYLSLQSVLSKPTDVCPGYGRDEGYDHRIADIVRYAEELTGRFPGIRIGLVDAMVAKGWDYAPVYRQLVAALRAKNLALDFIHLDFPAEAASPGWSNALAAQRVIRDELGLRFGLLYTSNDAGRTSDEAFYRAVMAAGRDFHAAGGRPDDLVVTSWHPHPAFDLPETDPTGHPFMNVVLDFARLGYVEPNPGASAPATPVATPAA
ncbi:MAG TPA: hypothetical protein VFQ80_17790 [Thermomicrobiales bacterium]|nr:hypothetical protein [Thermomicrobiales bacterium]